MKVILLQTDSPLDIAAIPAIQPFPTCILKYRERMLRATIRNWPPGSIPGKGPFIFVPSVFTAPAVDGIIRARPQEFLKLTV